MAQYELLLPKMGESVAEATVIKWLKQPGDLISLDDTLLEIATDKVDSEVPSPVAGKLIKQLYGEDEVVQVGDVIAIIETSGADVDSGNTVEQAAVSTSESVANEVLQQIPGTEKLDDAVSNQQDTSTANFHANGRDLNASQQEIAQQADQTADEASADYSKSSGTEADRFYSPLVKSIAAQEQISVAELNSIHGTGAEGRLTKDDLLNYIQHRVGRSQNAPAGAPVAEQPSTAPIVNTAKSAIAHPATSVGAADEIIEMDRMGKLIADHMVMSKHTSAHVTSFVEADVTNMVMWRERVKKNFEKRENEKITFTPIFIEAVAKAIKDFPLVNVSVNGTQIIKKKDINIGMAAALPSGNLIVPVIKNADQLNLVGLTKSVNDLATRARASKLKPDETQNGTFTLTNVGSFGNVMGTPIINQPQVAILAVGTIKKKPAVLETEYGDVIAIRHMMYLSLSYDHRVVNGALGGTFVRRVADYLENWDINREI